MTGLRVWVTVKSTKHEEEGKMNLLELEAQVRSLLDEPDPLGFFSSKEIKDWLNQGQYVVVEKVKHLRSSVNGYTTGEQKYLLPEDCMEIYHVKLNGETIGKVSFEELGRRKGYLLWEDGEIYISPDQVGSYLEIFFFRKPKRMDDDLSVPEMPEEFQVITLVNYAVSKAKGKDGKFEEAQYYEARFVDGVGDMMRRYARKPGKHIFSLK